jgi:lysophospholipase L1-like esterase
MLAAAALLLLAAAASALNIPASSPLLLFQGRTVYNATRKERLFDWEGVQIEVTLRNATTLAAQLTVPRGVGGRFRTFVDGDATSTELWVDASGTHTLTKSLQPTLAQHVRVYLMAEPHKTGTLEHGPWGFAGFTTDGTALPTAPRARRLEIVGDSITAGSGNVGKAPCTESVNDTDHSRSYGALLCAKLEANCSFVAYSGKGLYENCCAPFFYHLMPSWFWFNAYGSDTMTPWDHSAFVPDAVLVNLGTNDASRGKDNSSAWETAFVNTYVGFLANLTAAYGGRRSLPIFLGVGAITDNYLHLVQQTAAVARASAFNVTVVDMMNAEPNDGCNGHPGIAAHAAMAAIAEKAVKSVMGW